MRPLDVTIVGAGIGGLSCAIALREAGHAVHVYERAPELLPIGAGICMWPNGAAALRALGVAATLDEVSPLLRELSYRNAAGEPLRTMSLADLTERVKQRSYPLARADLHEALKARLGEADLTLNAECVGIDQDDRGVTTHFHDGSQARGDVLIAADGIRSVVRHHVLGHEIDLHHYYDSWVGLVDSSLDLTPDDTFMFHVGNQQRVGLLNVGRGRTYFFCDAPKDRDRDGDHSDARSHLQSLFGGWCERVARLIANVDTATVRLPIYDFDPLPSFIRGRVALLGDAAHGTTPTLGQGGALAMEDSLVLARHLSDCADTHAGLAAYDAERRPRSEQVVLAARARTQAMMGVIPEAEKAWYRNLKSDASQDFVDQLAEFAATSPVMAVAR